ncbi:hypothetical protein DQ04_09901010 [Trypanosoma grayi]|uniref:hypothetical protein n=1 Tax=Trypanosoma grayi TaxID=71804 RepID=UPI0004F45848|nr:hypothetical protein DQ04_09901010 [Trypanosoma grayi]KEG07403.1 hypothetical protein DQ04_09901010 [Trypanosoma grayi]
MGVEHGLQPGGGGVPQRHVLVVAAGHNAGLAVEQRGGGVPQSEIHERRVANERDTRRDVIGRRRRLVQHCRLVARRGKEDAVGRRHVTHVAGVNEPIRAEYEVVVVAVGHAAIE